MAKTKKVILFIVEGPTDEDALSPVLKKIFQSEDVRFHVVHGDMTTDWNMSGANAIKTVHDHINLERKLYGFERKDILQVIHLVDTDGAFIPDASVQYGELPVIQYFDDHIESAAPDKAVDRNHRKSQVLHRLYSAGAIGTLPYVAYYFSRNLEHVLHNDDGNLTDDEKMDYADAFSDRYDNDPEAFKTFVASAEFAVEGDYRGTWSYIMEGLHSLERHCNLHLLFQSPPQGLEVPK